MAVITTSPEATACVRREYPQAHIERLPLLAKYVRAFRQCRVRGHCVAPNRNRPAGFPWTQVSLEAASLHFWSDRYVLGPTGVRVRRRVSPNCLVNHILCFILSRSQHHRCIDRPHRQQVYGRSFDNCFPFRCTKRTHRRSLTLADLLDCRVVIWISRVRAPTKVLSSAAVELLHSSFLRA